MSGLYVHIPFCKHICSYCDFPKVFYNEASIMPYLEQLINELESYPSTAFKTFYLGGGTPSALECGALNYLFEALKPYVKDAIERTIEVNPETVTFEKMQLFKAFGINRLSIGVQSTNQDILDAINRKHHLDQVETVISWAKMLDIHNISIDLMYGLPNQEFEDIENDIAWAIKQNIQHISYYSLILEDHTVLKINGYQPLDEDLDATYYDRITSMLDEVGYHRYEISNYAKPGYESKHNTVYWLHQPFVGVGFKAASFDGMHRYQNQSTLSQYIKGEYKREQIFLTEDDWAFEHLMLGLRRMQGIEIKLFEERINKSIFEAFPSINKLINQQLLVIVDGYLKPSDEGIRLLNTVLTELME